MPEECSAEIKARGKCAVHSLLTMDVPTGIGQIIQCENSRTLSRLYRVMAYVLKFVEALKSRIPSAHDDVPGTLSLSVTEISKAEKL